MNSIPPEKDTDSQNGCESVIHPSTTYKEYTATSKMGVTSEESIENRIEERFSKQMDLSNKLL